MAVITRKQVEEALERDTVGDVRLLGHACLELLDHLEEHAPELVHAGEVAAQEQTVAGLKTLTAGRGHLANDGARDQLVAEQKRLDDLTKQPSVKDPDLGEEQNPIVDADPDRGPKTEVATETPSADEVSDGDTVTEPRPPYDKGSSAPTTGAHPGEGTPGDSADTIADAGGEVKEQQVKSEDKTPPTATDDSEPKATMAGDDEKDTRTKGYLMQEAKAKNIEGRSSMSRDELAEAVDGK